jgi:transcriptional regulator GlxA family with amidase domain
MESIDAAGGNENKLSVVARLVLEVGLLVFDEVEVLDFAGPFEVLSTAGRVAKKRGLPVPFRVSVIGRTTALVRARGGLGVVPDFSIDAHPPIDVLVIPGGAMDGVLTEADVVEWTRVTSKAARLTASICTGAFLLGKAGLLAGRRVTTHWEDVDDLRRAFPDAHVEAEPRYIDEGDLVTSAGISAGIDMSLHLVGRLVSAELATGTARQMDYAWQDR